VTALRRWLVCGGAHSQFLMQRRRALMMPRQIDSTENHGLQPDWVEATAFAWLAKQTLENRPGNLPAVTGASRAGRRLSGLISEAQELTLWIKTGPNAGQWERTCGVSHQCTSA
jgi:1,6-anhydro-N-acetylmuramate kinase